MSGRGSLRFALWQTFGPRSLVLGSATTSPLALAMFAPIGIFVVLVGNGTQHANFLWHGELWGPAVASQITVTLVVLIGAHVLARRTYQHIRLWRLLLILVAGAIRGIVMVLYMDAIDFPHPNTMLWRAFSSSWTTTVWLILIGFLIQGSRDYRQRYAELVQEEINLRKSSSTRQTSVEELMQWAALRERIYHAAADAREQLGADSEITAQSLHTAAEALAHSIDDLPAVENSPAGSTRLRPPKLPWRVFLIDALTEWVVPIGLVLSAAFGLIFIGALTRQSPLTALVFTALYVLVFALNLYLGRFAVRRFPRHAGWCMLTMVVALPIMLWFSAYLMLVLAPDTTGDRVGLIFAVLLAPVLLIVLTMMRRSSMDQRVLLDSLRVNIDQVVIELLTEQELAREAAIQLKLFSDTTIKSELDQVAHELELAAEIQNREMRQAVASLAAERLAGLPIEFHWTDARFTYARIFEVIQAWEKIVAIEFDLPEPTQVHEQLWKQAAFVIEEEVTDAAYLGRATSISIVGEKFGEGLVIKIRDNRTKVLSPERLAAIAQWRNELAYSRWLVRDVDGGIELLIRLELQS